MIFDEKEAYRVIRKLKDEMHAVKGNIEYENEIIDTALAVAYDFILAGEVSSEWYLSTCLDIRYWGMQKCLDEVQALPETVSDKYKDIPF